jgi:hypothetical protein
MNYCPDCGIPNPSDLHTCVEYERKIKLELTPDQEIMILKETIGELQAKVRELELWQN